MLLLNFKTGGTKSYNCILLRVGATGG